jgi:hypothetical protein
MSHPHSQRLNADQPPKKRVFMRHIAWVAIISELFSFLLLCIFHVAGSITYRVEDAMGILSGGAAYLGAALGILALILGWNDPKTRRLAVIGILLFVAMVIIGLVNFLLNFTIPGPH